MNNNFYSDPYAINFIFTFHTLYILTPSYQAVQPKTGRGPCPNLPNYPNPTGHALNRAKKIFRGTGNYNRLATPPKNKKTKFPRGKNRQKVNFSRVSAISLAVVNVLYCIVLYILI